MRIGFMLEQDFKLLLRNAIFWVLTATLVVIVILVDFVIPKDFSAAKTQVVTYGEQIPSAKEMGSAGEVEQYVKDNGAVGLIHEDEHYTLVHPGLGSTAAAAAAAVLIPPVTDLPQIDVSEIRDQNQAIPGNIRLLPIFICFEAMILGFLMAAVLMLGEKQEQVLKAYRISPGGAMRYVASKTVLFSVIGTLYAVLMAVATVGFNFNWIGFLLLSLFGCALYTLLGMSLTVFFKDLSGWFFTALILLTLNMLPVISYSQPAFSPGWVTAIPSYNAIFAYAETLFPAGKGVLLSIATLGAEMIGAFLLCGVLVRKVLLSAGREA